MARQLKLSQFNTEIQSASTRDLFQNIFNFGPISEVTSFCLDLDEKDTGLDKKTIDEIVGKNIIKRFAGLSRNMSIGRRFSSEWEEEDWNDMDNVVHESLSNTLKEVRKAIGDKMSPELEQKFQTIENMVESDVRGYAKDYLASHAQDHFIKIQNKGFEVIKNTIEQTYGKEVPQSIIDDHEAILSAYKNGRLNPGDVFDYKYKLVNDFAHHFGELSTTHLLTNLKTEMPNDDVRSFLADAGVEDTILVHKKVDAEFKGPQVEDSFYILNAQELAEHHKQDMVAENITDTQVNNAPANDAPTEKLVDNTNNPEAETPANTKVKAEDTIDKNDNKTTTDNIEAEAEAEEARRVQQAKNNQQKDSLGRIEPYIGSVEEQEENEQTVKIKQPEPEKRFKNDVSGHVTLGTQNKFNTIGGFLNNRLFKKTTEVAGPVVKNTLGALAIGAIMTTAVALGGGGALAWGLTAAAIGVFKHLYDKNKKPDVAPETVQNSPAQAKPAETGYLQSQELYDVVAKQGAKVDQLNQVNAVKEKESAELKDELARLKGQDGNSPLQDKNGVGEPKEGVSKIKPNGNDKPDAPSKEQGSLTNDDNKSFNISYKDWANMSDMEIKKQLEIMDRLTNEALARNQQLTSDIEALKAEIEGIKQTVTNNAAASASIDVATGLQGTSTFDAKSITDTIGQGGTSIQGSKISVVENKDVQWHSVAASDKSLVGAGQGTPTVTDDTKSDTKATQSTSTTLKLKT